MDNPNLIYDMLAGKKALIVDDEPSNIFIMKHLLVKGKMEVVTAINGLDGLEKLEDNPDIDCVLMDLMMPIMDGYEAIKEIRKQESHAELPIIVVTANAAANPKTFFTAGASDYLLKPVDKIKLFDMISAWLLPII